MKYSIKLIEEKLEALALTQSTSRSGLSEPRFTHDQDHNSNIVHQENEHFSEDKTIFQSEIEDTTWSLSTTDAINQVMMGNELTDSKVVNIDCRSERCKMKVNHDDQKALADFSLGFLMKIGAELPNITIRNTKNTDGTITSTVYLARN